MIDGIYFDPYLGWVTPSDMRETDTHRSLKEVITELSRGDAESETYDAVERLLCKYFNLVRVGVREDIAKHNGVSWYLTGVDERRERALISYQEGSHAEWRHECYADEVPLWLLVGLLRRIQHRKPLGDQEADETIAKVDGLDTAYVQAEHKHNPYRSYKTDERRL